MSEEADAVQAEPASSPAPPDAPPRDLSRWTAGILLLMVVALALGLRFYELDRRSAWLDEFWSLSNSAGKALETGQPRGVIIDPPPPSPTSLEGAGGWPEIRHAVLETTHPPLYYVVLRFWREAFGESQIVGRGMSVFFSIVGLLLVYDVGRRIGGRTTALWAALLMAVAVPQIVNAQEIRSYTLQLALAMAAASAVVRIEQNGATLPRLAGLCAALLASILTHYFSAGFALGLFGYAMLRLKGPARWKTLAAFVAAGALFLVLWGPSMWEQRVEFGVSATFNNWLHDPEPGRHWRAVLDMLQIPMQLITPLDEQTASLVYLGGALYVLPLVLWRKRPDLQLPALLLIGSVGLLAVMDAARSSTHLALLRYSFVASPAVFLLLAGLLRPMGWPQHILPAVAALSCILPLRSHYEDTYVDWRWPAGHLGLERFVRPGDVIIFASEGGPDYQAYTAFFGLTHYLEELPGPIVIAPTTLEPSVVRQLRAMDRKIYLVTGVGYVDVANVLPGAKPEVRHNYLGTVDVWEISWEQEAP